MNLQPKTFILYSVRLRIIQYFRLSLLNFQVYKSNLSPIQNKNLPFHTISCNRFPPESLQRRSLIINLTYKFRAINWLFIFKFRQFMDGSKDQKNKNESNKYKINKNENSINSNNEFEINKNQNNKNYGNKN